MNLPTKVKYTEPPTRPLTEVEILRARIKQLEAQLAEAEETQKRILGVLYGNNAGMVLEFIQKKRRPHVDP